MRSVDYDVVSYLRDIHGYTRGGNTDFSIYIGAEPPNPDNVVTVYASGGPPGKFSFSKTDPNVGYPSFQIRVRGRDQTEVDAKINEISEKLTQTGKWFVEEDTVTSTLPTGTAGTKITHYVDVTPVGGTVPLGMDENKRHLKVRNFRTIRENITI